MYRSRTGDDGFLAATDANRPDADVRVRVAREQGRTIGGPAERDAVVLNNPKDGSGDPSAGGGSTKPFAGLGAGFNAPQDVSGSRKMPVGIRASIVET